MVSINAITAVSGLKLPVAFVAVLCLSRLKPVLRQKFTPQV